MNGYYIIADFQLKGHTYCYGFKVKANDKETAQEKVKVRFEKYMRKWFNQLVDEEPDFKVYTKVVEEHIH